MGEVQVVPMQTDQSLGQDDRRTAEEIAAARDRIVGQLEKVIVGQKPVIEELLIALFSRGHCLLVGVPGLAKTLLISTLASVLDLTFNRVQFTPDLMPSDITGTDILEEDVTTGHRTFVFLKGPIFTNVLLADEINRTPPKTQALFRVGNAEPHRTRGHISATRGPARPLHVQCWHRLP
jgi:MoxR-like ATPase